MRPVVSFPIPNLPFLNKVIGRPIADQFQQQDGGKRKGWEERVWGKLLREQRPDGHKNQMDEQERDFGEEAPILQTEGGRKEPKKLGWESEASEMK